MFIRYDEYDQHGKPYSYWKWLQPTVTGLVIQSMLEGKVDVTKYPLINTVILLIIFLTSWRFLG